MKWLAVVVAFLFMAPVSVSANTRSEATTACKDVARRSWWRIKCNYSTFTENWTLKYKRGAYDLTVASGQHTELVRYLCSVAGTHVREMSGDHVMLIACEEPRSEAPRTVQ